MNPSEIRNILDTLQNINEQVLLEKSRGLLYRSPGDKFIQGDPKNPTATITFNKVDYYPGQPGEYATYEELAKKAQKIVLNYPGLQFCNSPIPGSTRALAVITLDGPQPGQKTYICRFFKRIDHAMDGAWKNNEIPGGWQLAKSSSLKSSYGLKPTDLLEPNATFNNALQLLNAVSATGKVDDLMTGLQMLLAKKLPVFENQKDMLGAIQDDLGEIMAPIALSMGMITDSGAESAKKDLLGGADWKGCKINFPPSKTNGLVDSYVYVNGIEVGISSKGDKGAKASIKNVQDGIDLAKADSSQAHKKALTKYAQQIKVIDKISSLPAKQFPIDYGIELGLITARQGEKINELINTGSKTLNQLTKVTAADKAVLDNLISGADANTSAQLYNIGYHALMVLARDVASAINSDPKFGEACLYFVNINPIIQIYLTATTVGEDVKVTKLTSLYPPNFQGTILLDAGKSYYASGNSGKMAFSYMPDKVAADKASSKQVSTAAINAKTAAKIDKVVNAKVSIRPPGTPRNEPKAVSPMRKKR